MNLAGVASLSKSLGVPGAIRQGCWGHKVVQLLLDPRGAHSATHQGAQDPVAQKPIVAGSAAIAAQLKGPGASSWGGRGPWVCGSVDLQGRHHNFGHSGFRVPGRVQGQSGWWCSWVPSLGWFPIQDGMISVFKSLIIGSFYLIDIGHLLHLSFYSLYSLSKTFL